MTGIRTSGLFKLRERVRGSIPGFLRGPARWTLRRITSRCGLAVTVAGRVVRFLPGSEPALDEAQDTSRVRRLDRFQIVAFLDALRPGICVADVGAFRGTYTLLARSIVGPTGLVVAFEPSVESGSFLERNLRINHFHQGVIVEPVAVAETKGERRFHGNGSHSMNSLFESGATGGGKRRVRREEARVVPTIDLDSFFEDLGRFPDVVKIDVEGSEFEALKGAARILESEARIFCEFHPYAWKEAGHDADDLGTWLKARGRVPISIETGAVVERPEYGPVELMTIGRAGAGADTET